MPRSPAAPTAPLRSHPPYEQWNDWVELDPKAWPQRVERHYSIVPTICFNCESACGLLAYVDHETGKIKKLEGNPLHPASRGRTCAKGPAVLAQIDSPNRILYPLRRKGARGGGEWERIGWDEVIDLLATRVRKALLETRGEEIMYHVGRPGHDGYMERVLQAWGIDGHNSHTNICSAGARLGYALTTGIDRPSPDYANARFILLVSSHLETGHYFNPHAQRIVEAKTAGAKLAVIDPRLSNTASMADYWLAPHPGTEAKLLLAMARVILDSGRVDAAFLREWVALDALPGLAAETPATVEGFVELLREHTRDHDLASVERECGVSGELVQKVALEIAGAGSRFSSHVWRAAASGNLGGWQAARGLLLLHALTGSIGTPGGLAMNAWNKFVPKPFSTPAPQPRWNELLYPPEWPLSHHELSQLLPHFLKEGRGRLDTYFTRVFNPVWTYPDGLSWLEVLRDERLVGFHAALTPVWSETAWQADLVLPMGMSTERHDLMSHETHASRWLGFRQPVLRVWREGRGETITRTYEANPGEVWEEDEFWIALSWAIDPDGSLGVRRHFESPYRPGERVTVAEYYQHIFEHAVPGLPEAAAAEELTPLAYMRRHGCFEVAHDTYGIPGLKTPSEKLELASPTLAAWGWPEHALPSYTQSHVGPAAVAHAQGAAATAFDAKTTPGVDWPPEAAGEVLVLLPIFRLPTLIHTRTNDAKWLYEISHRNPLWIAPPDAERLGVATGDLVKLHTEIGWFVNAAWVTEGLRPGVVACSHHLGRWRENREQGSDRYTSALVDLGEVGPGRWLLRHKEGVTPHSSRDRDTERVWWTEAGVHQNLTFPVHPDPVSGMHCWHQLVKVERAAPTDRYGDVFVDTNRSHQVYQKWKAFARPAPGPEGLRRPRWLARVARPAPEAYVMRAPEAK